MKPFRANHNDVVKNFAVVMSAAMKRVDYRLKANFIWQIRLVTGMSDVRFVKYIFFMRDLSLAYDVRFVTGMKNVRCDTGMQ